MRTARLAATALGALALLLFLVLAALAGIGSASLPQLEGRAHLAGLSAPLSVERDHDGVPTLRARNRRDLARALGYLHGEDRFFQMDLLRRAAAGELSALFGPVALKADRSLRVHRFRSVARSIVEGLDAPSRALLDAYVEGVNAGLGSLASEPPEYWVLGAKPKAWSAEDTVLCVHAMFLDLQDSAGHLQLQRGLLRATLPPAAWKLIEAGAPEWDAAIDGSRSAEPVLPTAQEYDLRAYPAGLPVDPPPHFVREVDLGSNNWAVAGMHTARGGAVLANDMHLTFRVPIIWYRARLIVEPAAASPDAGAMPLAVTGVTLPGSPGIVAGSNGSIAWGFTNSYGQYSTLIRLVPVADDPNAYATAAGPQKLVPVDELIEVKGAAPEHLVVETTPWGPVVGRDWEGKDLVLDWTAHDPAATNLRLIELETARSAQAALELGAGFGMPGQNLLVADRAGHIGWTIAGRIPHRDPAQVVPQLSTEASLGFQGWVSPEEQPRVLDPPGGLLWSANARVVGGEAAQLIGDDGLDRGARAGQIAEDLRAAPRPFAPRDSLAIQLDDRARFLERWRALLGKVIALERARGDETQAAAAAVLATWSGHALPGDAAFRWVRQFRAEVETRVFFMLIAPARQRAPAFEFELPSSFEGPLWRLLEARPAHLLAASYADWDALLRDALHASEAVPPSCRDLAHCTWGAVNAVHIEHPLARALPLIAPLLDMPGVEVPGAHHDMPRIQGPDYGASERFSVTPGEEAQGYFHMPGGESAHPFSPYYRAGFAAWREGLATPFLPGALEHTLVLEP
ncbi:MAG TPA: penicillin acylase family protein [Steroidobacteraceae bacterium]|nr:penicillin acylase family protein [Steroidobacteraceae bacterium]